VARDPARWSHDGLSRPQQANCEVGRLPTKLFAEHGKISPTKIYRKVD